MGKFKKLFTLALAGCLFLSGCGSAEETQKTENEKYAYLKNLEEGMYYVRHNNLKCDEVYLGATTFEAEELTSSASNDRVMWFDENMYKKIPTLYKGESLIYKTSQEITETFNFERFEDFGYSIGLCGLTKTASGRYSISTNPDDNNTFPGGDTDALLKLENESVIIDTLGGDKLRAPKDIDGKEVPGGPLTRCNSIKGLAKDFVYKAEVYKGTKRLEYKFTADIRIMGSMEIRETNDYNFESETVMNISIPDNFNSGYYMINGMGIFRYVNGDKYTSETDFNVPNETEDAENNEVMSDTEDPNYESTEAEGETTGSDSETSDDISKTTFTLEESGIIRVSATFGVIDNGSQVTGIIVTPSGEKYAMTNTGGVVELTFDAAETGDYTVLLYDLGGASAEVTADYAN